MGLNVLLQAKVAVSGAPAVKSPAAIAATLEALCRPHTSDTTTTCIGETFVVSASLHPAAQPVEFRIGPQGALSASAKTSTVGPGYHQWVCEWLDEVATALGTHWDKNDESDSTGYFVSRDRPRLEAAFLSWLTTTAKLVVERTSTGMTGLAVSLPAGDVQFLAPGFALTPLGPRDEAWWRQAATEASACTDLFPWWRPGHGPHEVAGRALCLMWGDVVWRAPLTQREQRIHREVRALLAAGFQKEPKFEWPWREWLELLELGGAPNAELMEKVRARAAKSTGPLVGYLRHDVRVSMTGGWSVRVPGTFARVLEPDGVTVRLGDASRTVFVMTGGTDPDLKQAPPPKGTGERLTRTEKKLDSAALVTPHERGWQLVSNTVVPGEMAVVTVQFPEAEREWALATWKSIAHPGWRR